MAFPQPSAVRFSPFPLLVCTVIAAALVLAITKPDPALNSLRVLAELASNSIFLFLGMLGAIFANATGAGGGVVFIPAFSQLGFTEAQSVATSFGIQCFGMTAGALTWSRFYRSERTACHEWRPFVPIAALCSAASIAGLWTVFAQGIPSPAAVGVMFATFSLFLGASILVVVFRGDRGQLRTSLPLVDLVALALIAYGGGMVTAWLSVGVGEFVAFYLIVRRYDVTLSVAAAVVISAATVWSAAPEQLLFSQQVNWPVLAFAGPGAVIGGLVARRLVLKLGVHRLKLFFGSWLLIIGVVEFLPVA